MAIAFLWRRVFPIKWRYLTVCVRCAVWLFSYLTYPETLTRNPIAYGVSGQWQPKTWAHPWAHPCQLVISRPLASCLLGFLGFWTLAAPTSPPLALRPLPNMYHNIIKNSGASVAITPAPMFVEFGVEVGYRLLENITVKNRACRI